MSEHLNIPTHIVVSKERLMFRLGGKQFEYFPGQIPAKGVFPAADPLFERWQDWRAGRITDVEMLEPI